MVQNIISMAKTLNEAAITKFTEICAIEAVPEKITFRGRKKENIACPETIGRLAVAILKLAVR